MEVKLGGSERTLRAQAAYGTDHDTDREEEKKSGPLTLMHRERMSSVGIGLCTSCTTRNHNKKPQQVRFRTRHLHVRDFQFAHSVKIHQRSSALDQPDTPAPSFPLRRRHRVQTILDVVSMHLESWGACVRTDGHRKLESSRRHAPLFSLCLSHASQRGCSAEALPPPAFIACFPSTGQFYTQASSRGFIACFLSPRSLHPGALRFQSRAAILPELLQCMLPSSGPSSS